jgi:hypothetical protein
MRLEMVRCELKSRSYQSIFFELRHREATAALPKVCGHKGAIVRLLMTHRVGSEPSKCKMRFDTLRCA